MPVSSVSSKVDFMLQLIVYISIDTDYSQDDVELPPVPFASSKKPIENTEVTCMIHKLLFV